MGSRSRAAANLRLARALAVLAAVVLGLPRAAVRVLRGRIMSEAQRDLRTMADVTAVAVDRRLQAIRFALSALPAALDGEALESGLGDAEAHLALRGVQGAAGDGSGCIAIAPSGRRAAAAFAIETPGGPVNLLDRPAIATLGPSTPSGLTISAPYETSARHVAGRPAVSVSRVLRRGGWAQAIVLLDVPSGLLPAADHGKGTRSVLMREDGQVVALWPPPVPLPAQRFDRTLFETEAMTGARTLRAMPGAPLGEAAAITAWRALPEFGLVLVVRRDVAAVLAPWWMGMAIVLAAVVLALATAGMLAWQAARRAAARSDSEHRATLVADTLGLLLWSKRGLDAVSAYHSKGAEQLTGYPIEELTRDAGFWRERVIHPEDRASAWAELKGADRARVLHRAYRIIRKDGAVRWLEERIRFSPDGSLSGVSSDITELRETQQRLHRREAELAEAMRVSGLASWRYVPGEDRYTVSDAIFAQFGVDKASFEPTMANIVSLIVPEDRPIVAEAMARAAATGEAVEYEYRLRRPDGTVRRRWSRAVGESSGHGRTGAIIGISLDVTERREAAEQLAHASRMAALGQLTGGIAHDVNNMLTVVSLNLDLLGDQVRPGTPGADALEAALAAAAGGAALTAQLLAFSRRQPLAPAAVPLPPLFAGLGPMLARTLGRDIVPRLSVAPGTPAVLADLGQLRSALLNLAINARDAMPGGGALTITAAPAPTPGLVAFAVADEGEGMPPEVAARAFEPFFTTKAAGKGTGLGLSQVYGFVTQSQGTIAIESAPGAGTVVRFTLPAAAAARGATAPAAAGPPPGRAGPGGEDEPALRVAVSAMCRAAGLVVAEAEHAAAAMAAIEAGFVPDLLFTDINLGPGPNGVMLAKLVRRRFPALRVLLATGYAADVAVPEGEMLLRKPYAREALLAAVAAALAAGRETAPSAA